MSSAEEAELREHAASKQELLSEAQALLPVTDARAALSALGSIKERWELADPMPHEASERLESGLRQVEEAVRRAEANRRRRANPEAFARAEGTVAQLRVTITQLEEQLVRAHEGDDARAVHNAEEALAARRARLQEAERALDEFST